MRARAANPLSGEKLELALASIFLTSPTERSWGVRLGIFCATFVMLGRKLGPGEGVRDLGPGETEWRGPGEAWRDWAGVVNSLAVAADGNMRAFLLLPSGLARRLRRETPRILPLPARRTWHPLLPL